jgi:hypothetical protein
VQDDDRFRATKPQTAASLKQTHGTPRHDFRKSLGHYREQPDSGMNILFRESEKSTLAGLSRPFAEASAANAKLGRGQSSKSPRVSREK